MLNFIHHQGNANSNHKYAITPHLTEYYKKQHTTCVGKNVEKWIPFSTVGRNANWYSYYEKHVEFPQKFKNKTTMKSRIFIPGYLSEENKNTNLNDICTLTFTAALFTIAKVCKQPKCPLIDEWIYIHTHTQIYTYTSTHTR